MSGTHPTAERRQAPRLAIDGQIECRLDLRTRVRLLDISLGGALLAAESTLPMGASAQLRSALGGTEVRIEVEVRRTVALPDGSPLHGLGAIFTTMDPRSRRCLEDFLRKASQ